MSRTELINKILKKAVFSLYSIKNIVCKLDKNINTQIVNIDFDI